MTNPPRVLRVTLPLLAALLATLIAWQYPSPADAAIRLGYTYNTPTATRDDQQLGDDMVDLISGVPCDGQLDVILYSVSDRRQADALLGRAACGTRVRLLTSHAKPDGEGDGIPLWGEMDRLINGDRTTPGLRKYGARVLLSYGALALRGKDDQLEHEKIVRASSSRGVQWIVRSSSGNWTRETGRAFNDDLTMSDRCLYDGVGQHVDRLFAVNAKGGKSLRSEAPVKSCGGSRSIYFLPGAHTDPVVKRAQTARCGRGDVIDFGNFYFTSSKSELIDALLRQVRAGATVRVGANDAKWSDKQRRRLVVGGAQVYDVNFGDVYMHRKGYDDTGCDGGPWGAQGSTTMNDTAYRNGNQIVTTTYAPDVQGMRRGFDAMIAGRHRFTPADVGCVGKRQPSGC